MNEEQFIQTLQTQANDYLNQGQSVEEVQAWVDRQKQRWSESQAGKPVESEIEEVPQAPEVTDSELVDTGSESSEPQTEEDIAEHNLRAEAGKAVLSSVTKIPEWAIEPISAFVSTLAETGAGAVKAVEQFAYDRAQTLVENGKIPAVNPENGQKIYLDEELEKMTPDERLEVFNDWYVAGDKLDGIIEPLQNLQEIHGSGSISTEFAQGNYGEAARLTANQSAAGLASLVPFLIPGGQVLGPAILGASVVGSEFEAGLERENATMDQIRLASYAKGANEFAWEFVTAGIVGKAQKLAAGGAAKQAVNRFGQAAWKEVLGDTFSEAISEGLTDTGNRIIDKFVFGDEWDGKAAVVGFVDSAIVGGIVGGKVSTFGQIGANNAGRDIAANSLKPEVQKAEDQADIEEINNNKQILDEKAALGTEGSLVDQVVAQEAAQNMKEASERIKDRQKKNVETLSDMTKPEINTYAEALDKIKKLEAEIQRIQKVEEKTKPETPQDIQPLQDAIQREQVKADNVYNTVANWTQTTTQIDNVVKQNEAKLDEIKQERKKIDLQRKAHEAHEAPNPVATFDLNQKESKLNTEEKAAKKNIKAVRKVEDAARPTIADAKLRKAKAKRPAPLDNVPTEVKNQEERAAANQDLETILADKTLPDTQKGRVLQRVLKLNDPIVGKYASEVANRYANTDAEYKQLFPKVKEVLKSDAARRIVETGKIDNNTWNAARAAANRFVKKENETVSHGERVNQEMKRELREITEQVKNGELDPEIAEIYKDDIRAEYGLLTQGESIDTTNEEGIQQERADVTEKLQERETEADLRTKENEYNRILEGTTLEEKNKHIDEMMNEFNFRNNIPNLYKLLPKSAHTGRSLSGKFKDGNMPVEEWLNYFDKSTETGRKRFNRLKKAIKDNVGKTLGAGVDTQNLTDSDIKNGSVDYLEDKPAKTDVKRFLPLLGMLKRAFPETRVIISKSRMIEDFIEAGIDPGKVDSVKGYTDGNVVILNPERLDYETPIHEFGHIWAQATRQLRPDLYAKGVELIKKSPYYLETLEKSKDPNSVYYGHSQERIEEEAMATSIGQAGQQFFEKSQDVTAWNKLSKQIWDWINEKLGMKKVQDLTFDQFNKIAVTEILTGERFITEGQAELFEKSLGRNFLVRETETRNTGNYQKTPEEVDTHFRNNRKGHGWKEDVADLSRLAKKYDAELDGGAVIPYSVGNYAKNQAEWDSKIVPFTKHGPEDFNPAVSRRLYKKVESVRKNLPSDYELINPTKTNPGVLALKKKLSFLEVDDVNADAIRKEINRDIKRALAATNKKAAFGHSKIDQATREVLKATQLDLSKRGDNLTVDQLAQLQELVNDAIEGGKDNIKKIREDFNKQKEETRLFVNQAIKDTSGLDLSKLNANQIKAYNKGRRGFLKGRKTGFSDMLSPATNNDFYGLLYNMLPKGANRLNVKNKIDQLLIKPLEKANLSYLGNKRQLTNEWLSAKAAYNKAKGKDDINTDSGITIEGIDGDINLTKSQVLKLYNYIKDPNLFKQLEAGGVNLDKINEIVEYVKADSALEQYADNITKIYSKAGAKINQKLDSHGRETFGKIRIDKSKLSPEQIEVLEKVYGEVLPSFAPYTPLTAEGADVDLEVDNLISEGNYAMYSVMDGRLKKRTRGGQAVVFGTNLDSDFDSYLRGPVRTLSYLDFAKNAGNFFGKKQLDGMKAAYGDAWVSSMKDSLKRIVTGRNTTRLDTPAAKALNKWINYSIGGIMFLNVRSAALQLISAANFVFDDPSLTGEGLRPRNRELKKQIAKEIRNSDWYQERGKGKTELALDEISDQVDQNRLEKLLEFGYNPTKWGDRTAIALGGIPYATGLYLQLQKANPAMTHEQLMEEVLTSFVSKAEESQQSTRPERLGREQATPLGKLILAFANTPMQYNRKIARAVKDLSGLRGVNTDAAKARKAQALREIVWYTGLQNALFTSAQKLAFAGFGLDSGDEDKRSLDWANSLLNTLLRGAGLYGALAAAVKDALLAAAHDKPVVNAVVNVSPGIGTKVRNLETALGQKPIYPKSDFMADVDQDTAEAIYRTSAALTGLGLPADKAIKVAEQLADVVSSDLSLYQRTLRAFGWDRYQLGESASNSPLNKLGEGEMGQAFNDGTIEIDPNLKGEEREKTVKHEQKHADDMRDGKLGYDNEHVYWKGSAFKRRNGKIKWGSKWMKEGDPNLPWEKEAYDAEKDPITPLKRYVNPDTGEEINPYANQNYTDLSQSADQVDSILESYGLPTGSPVNKIKRSKEQGKNVWKNQTYHDLGDAEALLMEQLAAYGLPTEGSPLLQTDHDEDEHRREKEAEHRKLVRNQAAKYGFEDKSGQDIRWIPQAQGGRGTEQYGGTHYKPQFVGHAGDFEEAQGPEHFEAAKGWTESWESDPITIAKDMARTGATENEIIHALERQKKAQYEAIERGGSTAATYDPHEHTIVDNPNFQGAEGYSPESVTAHEFAHAGRDLPRGLHVQEILGRVSTGLDKEFESYVNRPHELYGFLQQARHELGLKPGQDLTPEMIEKAKKKGSKNPLYNVDPAKLIEANKKVAQQEAMGEVENRLRSLYSNNQNTYVT